jgi:cyclase
MKLRAWFVIALSCIGARCTVEAAPPYPFSFDTVKVAEGIYAFIEPPGKAIVSGNTLLVIGEDAALVVDTGHHPELSRRMTEEIRKLTAKPVKYIVNTHWHNDHVAGNSVFADAFPDARFIAHAFTADVLDREVRPYYGPRCVQLGVNQTKSYRDLLAKGVGSDGKPFPDDRKARIEAALHQADVAMEECKAMRYRGSDIAFGEKMTLRLGGRAVELLWLGRANTAGDAVIYVPDAKVVATGDIVVHPFPFATQSYIGEWGQVLRKIEAMETVAIVPGHGPVMRDKKYIADLAELMESIMRQARAAYRPGMSVDELRGKIDLEPHRARIAGGNALIDANFNAMVKSSAIARAFQELEGKLEPEAMPKG